MSHSPLFSFILGREFKLSLAEIYSVFPAAHFEAVSETFALLSGIPREEVIERFARLGGTIKVVEILDECDDVPDFTQVASDYLAGLDTDGKTSFAIASYGEKMDNFTVGLRVKKEARSASGKSLRLVNKDPKNINSAVYKKEKLSETETELNSIVVGNIRYFGWTIAYQDVDLYAARDIGKERDMEVGMLPPKLAQMMVNLSNNETAPSKSTVYDPFCGLGTILIEAVNMGYAGVIGSDLSPEMVRASEENSKKFIQEKGLSTSVTFSAFRADAAKLRDFLDTKLPVNTAIVTEGYLGEIMTPRTISDDRIASERRKLGRMYDGFFGSLKAMNFTGNIVISFPFWELRGRYVYLEEGYEAFRRHGFQAEQLLPDGIEWKETKSGSLLYKRPGQTVGREVLKLNIGKTSK